MVIYPVDGVVNLLINNWGCVHAISVDELFVCKKVQYQREKCTFQLETENVFFHHENCF